MLRIAGAHLAGLIFLFALNSAVQRGFGDLQRL
jgi:hypothetical protein